MAGVAFLNGEYVPLEDAKVGIMTHALHYGTGAFEGIRGNWNAGDSKMYMFKLREHYERMLRGCKMLWMDPGYTIDELCQITIEVVERSGFQVGGKSRKPKLALPRRWFHVPGRSIRELHRL
jgi:branched-chain amino acid aminotransferase